MFSFHSVPSCTRPRGRSTLGDSWQRWHRTCPWTVSQVATSSGEPTSQDPLHCTSLQMPGHHGEPAKTRGQSPNTLQQQLQTVVQTANRMTLFFILKQGISDTGNVTEMSMRKQVDSSLLYLPYQLHAFLPWPSHSWFPCISRHRSLAGRYRWSQLSLASSSAGTGGTGSPSHILDKVHHTAPANRAKIGHNRTQVFKLCVFNNATLKTQTD